MARWAPRLVTFAVWALALASAVYWGLKSTSEPGGPQAAVLAQGRAPIDTGAVARLLGGAPQGPATVALVNPSTRFALVGVIAGQGTGGAALIAVDGKPPKPYRVGSVVDGDLLLQSVAPAAPNWPRAWTARPRSRWKCRLGNRYTPRLHTACFRQPPCRGQHQQPGEASSAVFLEGVGFG